MEGEERRAKILDILKERKTPVSGTSLARELSVSRQIVVGDIALLRAHGTEIIATNSGYLIADFSNKTKTFRVYCRHRLEDAYDEYCTILDEGARIINEGIVHDVYGEVIVPLNIMNRADAKRHTEKMLNGNCEDIMILSGNNHFHTLEAESDLTVLRVQRALHEKSYLVK